MKRVHHRSGERRGNVYASRKLPRQKGLSLSTAIENYIDLAIDNRSRRPRIPFQCTPACEPIPAFSAGTIISSSLSHYFAVYQSLFGGNIFKQLDEIATGKGGCLRSG